MVLAGVLASTSAITCAGVDRGGLVGGGAPAAAEPESPVGAPGGSLAGRCLMMRGAGRAACRAPSIVLSPALQPVLPPASPAAPHPDMHSGLDSGLGYADLAGAYSIYRLISATDEQRRCRLQPTCSLFAAHAARRFGLLRGLLMGFARAQMSHTDQDGFLPYAVASDGRFIYLDPLERWIHAR